MTLYDLWLVCPRSHVFIFVGNEWVEYTGCGKYSSWLVTDVEAASLPCYRSALLVKI